MIIKNLRLYCLLADYLLDSLTTWKYEDEDNQY